MNMHSIEEEAFLRGEEITEKYLEFCNKILAVPDKDFDKSTTSVIHCSLVLLSFWYTGKTEMDHDEVQEKMHHLSSIIAQTNRTKNVLRTEN